LTFPQRFYSAGNRPAHLEPAVVIVKPNIQTRRAVFRSAFVSDTRRADIRNLLSTKNMDRTPADD
jgi:hypothetical protein